MAQESSLTIADQEAPKIIIVGAGLAGLSAASRLIELGHKNLLILEAKRKPGGRIETILSEDGSRLDLGAQWLHGEKENPIYHWLESLNLIDGPEEEEVEFEGLFRTQFGTSPARDEISKLLESLLDAKRSLYEMAATLPQDSSSKPVDIYRIALENNPSNNLVLKSAVRRWFELYETIDNSCEDLSQLSMQAYSDWTDFDRGAMVRLKGGWQSVVDALVSLIGVERILLDCQVRKITYTSDGVVVAHSKGCERCDHVIMTPSIGVLRDLESDFFEPALGELKMDAMNSSGFGVVNKIFLQFERPFLQHEKGLKLLWITEDEMSALPPDELPGWTKFLTGFELVDGAPNYLLGWVGGLGAVEMERYSDEQIAATCRAIFKNFIPDIEVPKLISAKCSAWYGDPFVKGAYSYKSVRSQTPLDMDDPWEPLFSSVFQREGPRKPLVQFAGEATAGRMYATSHGAIISGWREADRLNQFMNQTTPT